MKRKAASRRPPRPSPTAVWLRRWLPLLVLVSLPALIVAPGAKESFRFPKLLVTESLGLLSLLILSWRVRPVGRVALRDLVRRPVIVAVVPLLVIATAGLVTSDHPLHVRRGLVSLWIAAACLAGWSFALKGEEHRRILTSLLAPAVILSLIAIGQFHGLLELFRFQEALQERIAVTSLAGGAFDLAGYLVLPVLWGQLQLYRGSRDRSWLWSLALVPCVYAIALTQTLTAIAALVLASLVLWAGLLPRRRLVAGVALVAVLGVGLGLGIEPLRQRLERKVQSLRDGDFDLLLTGRLDGWRGALWMFREHPWTGVGHGAYRAEFGDARLALTAAGRRFYERQHQTYFGNAHNELLEAAAEWGIPGLLALTWGIWRLFLRLRRRSAEAGDSLQRADVAMMWAGVAALAVLALTNFPLRIALVGYPYLILLSWIFSPARSPGAAHEKAAGGPGIDGRRLFWLLVPLLAIALALELRQAGRRWRASHQLAAVERTTAQLGQQGLLARRPPPADVRRLLEQGTGLMRDAAVLDPVEVGIPIARGSLYYLLDRPRAAIRAYEEALELESRAEIHANLGRAHLLAGDEEAAVEAFQTARRLNNTRRFRRLLRDLERRTAAEDPG